MTKPLLLLDVDGAVSPIRGDDDTYPAGVEWLEVTKLFGPVLVDARLPEWLARLSERYELVWATTWGEGANSRLSAPLGLPELPWIDFESVSSRRLEDSDRRYGCPKLAAVRDYLSARRLPAAWVDDSITLAVLRWARRQRQPLLFLPTHVHVGVTERHVERLERWAEGLRTT